MNDRVFRRLRIKRTYAKQRKKLRKLLNGSKEFYPSGGDKSKIIIRPSGTEPRLKVYLATQTAAESIKKGLEACNKRLETLIAALEQDL